MRIVCESCGAAFSIDDRRIPASGARAACPKCRHQTFVRPPPPEPPPAPPSQTAPPGSASFLVAPTGPSQAAPGNAPVADRTGPPPPTAQPLWPPVGGPQSSAPVGDDPFQLDFGDGKTTLPGVNVPPAAQARLDALAAQPPVPSPFDDPFDLDLPPADAPPLPPPAPAPPAARPTLPPDPLERDSHRTGEYAVPEGAAAAYAALAAHPSARALPEDPLERGSRKTGEFAVPENAARGYETMSGGSLPPRPPDDLSKRLDEAVGNAPPDPVEAGSGDELSRRLSEAAAGAPAEEAEWRVKKPGGIVEGPFTATELVARFEAGLVTPNDLVAQGATPFEPLGAFALTAGFLKEKVQRGVTAVASSERSFPWRTVSRVAAVVAGAALGAAVFTLRPSIVFGPPPAAADRAALGIIEKWRESENVPFASSDELYQLARGYLAGDTRESLRKATETFRRALVRDPKHLRAMAGFAEARARVAIDDGDADGLREAAELIGYALRNGGVFPEVRVAHANILTFTGTDSDLIAARDEVQAALLIDPQRADVQLATARAFATRNEAFALEALQKAAKLDPSLHAVPLLLGEVYARMGRLPEAREALAKRKALVPDNTAADLVLARLEALEDDVASARRRIDALGRTGARSLDARLLGAQVAYQLEGRPDEALATLEGILAERPDRRRLQAAHVHAAAAAHLAGDLARVQRHLDAGLALDVGYAPLHFRRALLALQRGDTATAIEAIGRTADTMPDRPQRSLVVARIHMAAGRLDEAQAELSRASLQAPHRPAPYLVSAGLYAATGQLPQALRRIRQALGANPSWATTHRKLTEWHEPPLDLTETIEALESFASLHDEPWLALGGVALARYVGGDPEGAERVARAAIRRRSRALVARVVLARVLVDRGENVEAIENLEEAATIDRDCALLHTLWGEALLALESPSEAHARFRDALEADPAFSAAVAGDGRALLAEGRGDEARVRLLQAMRTDPDDNGVRRVLSRLPPPPPPAN